METVADGDCGLDGLIVADGTARNLENRMLLRRAIRGVLIANAGNPAWANVVTATQELEVAGDQLPKRRKHPLAHGRGQTTSATWSHGSATSATCSRLSPAPTAAVEPKGFSSAAGEGPVPLPQRRNPRAPVAMLHCLPPILLWARCPPQRWMRRYGGPRACQTRRRR